MPDTIASVLAYEADLTKTIQKTILRDLFVTEDKNAHTFRVKITRSGEPVDLTGATVTGYFMRYKDRVSIPLTGTVEGSEAVLTLKDGCYSMRTMFCVTLCVALGGAKHAVFAGEGQMVLNRSDAIADPENVIPSIEDIIAQYDLMVSGTNAANTAASSANTAAGKANTAASTANTATTNANNATARANNAAAALETAPVPTGTVVTYQAGTSATTPPTGTWLANPPTVPQGQYLWTCTVQSFTNGDPVTSYSVARQGMDGSGSVSSVNGVAPDTAGNVQLDTIANAQKLGGKEPSAYLDVRDLTADELTAMDTAARAALYADGARVLKVTNGETVVLLTLNAEGATQWAGGEIPRNLLDNSDFTNPVNQRWQTSYTAQGYTIDRWNVYSPTSVEVNPNYISVVGSTSANTWFRQYINSSLLFGKTLTLAVKTSDGNIYLATGTYPAENPTSETTVALIDAENFNLYISAQTNKGAAQLKLYKGATVNCEWAALYEGSYTADTLPPYVPKENELAACKRRFRRIGKGKTSDALVFNGYVTSSGKEIFVAIDGIEDMSNVDQTNSKPTVSYSGKIVIRGTTGYCEDATASSPMTGAIITAKYTDDGVGALLIKKSDDSAFAGIANNTVVAVVFTEGSYIDISNDL